MGDNLKPVYASTRRCKLSMSTTNAGVGKSRSNHPSAPIPPNVIVSTIDTIGEIMMRGSNSAMSVVESHISWLPNHDIRESSQMPASIGGCSLSSGGSLMCCATVRHSVLVLSWCRTVTSRVQRGWMLRQSWPPARITTSLEVQYVSTVDRHKTCDHSNLFLGRVLVVVPAQPKHPSSLIVPPAGTRIESTSTSTNATEGTTIGWHQPRVSSNNTTSLDPNDEGKSRNQFISQNLRSFHSYSQSSIHWLIDWFN